jgi:hypothetical protein
VVSLAWVPGAGPGPLLVAGAQGGALVRWSRGEDGRLRPLEPAIAHPGIVTVLIPVPGGDGSRVLAGSPGGHRMIYNASDGSVAFELSRDDARIVGAAVVDASPPVLVTAHLARDAAGLRVWDPLTGRQQRAVRHPTGPGDTYAGRPRPGRTADGRPFVAYDVEDGIELLWLDRAAYGDEPVRLLLPFTVNDVTVHDDRVFIAGGGGFLLLTVTRPAARP